MPNTASRIVYGLITEPHADYTEVLGYFAANNIDAKEEIDAVARQVAEAGNFDALIEFVRWLRGDANAFAYETDEQGNLYGERVAACIMGDGPNPTAGGALKDYRSFVQAHVARRNVDINDPDACLLSNEHRNCILVHAETFRINRDNDRQKRKGGHD